MDTAKLNAYLGDLEPLASGRVLDQFTPWGSVLPKGGIVVAAGLKVVLHAGHSTGHGHAGGHVCAMLPHGEGTVCRVHIRRDGAGGLLGRQEALVA